MRSARSKWNALTSTRPPNGLARCGWPVREATLSPRSSSRLEMCRPLYPNAPVTA